jgi:UDP-N-acetyl-D-glucosamine dehydrogenase
MESTKITVLGKAFKADIDDDRLSPSLRVIEMLERLGANVVVHDPYLSDIQLDEALSGAHGVVLATNHSMYYKLDLSRLAELVHEDCVIVDAWGVFDSKTAADLGLELNTFGRG